MADARIHGEAFNFSNELQISVLELTHKILKLMGREDLKPTILNQAEHEIKHQYLSASKARDLLEWQPKYDFEDALKETVAWYTEFLQS
jgi:CDP-glucose 4,6-dehydratase